MLPHGPPGCRWGPAGNHRGLWSVSKCNKVGQSGYVLLRAPIPSGVVCVCVCVTKPRPRRGIIFLQMKAVAISSGCRAGNSSISGIRE